MWSVAHAAMVMHVIPRRDPIGPHLQPPMIGLYRFLILIRALATVVGCGIVQKKRDGLIERRMVLFERQDISGALLADGAGDVLLTAHGIDHHEASLQNPTVLRVWESP